jgi:hypothetical protein
MLGSDVVDARGGRILGSESISEFAVQIVIPRSARASAMLCV